MKVEGFTPPSVEILRERGSMSVRELTQATAKLLRVAVMYDDVDAVLRTAARRGEVVVAEEKDDFRDTVWKAM